MSTQLDYPTVVSIPAHLLTCCLACVPCPCIHASLRKPSHCPLLCLRTHVCLEVISKNDVDVGMRLPVRLAITTAGSSSGARSLQDEQRQQQHQSALSEDTGPTQAPHAHAGPAFAFDYGQLSAKQQQQQQQPDLPGAAAQLRSHAQAVGYAPPFSAIPPHLAHHLPDNEKTHKVGPAALPGLGLLEHADCMMLCLTTSCCST